PPGLVTPGVPHPPAPLPAPLLSEHTARGADSVERVGLPARAALPPHPTHLEHALTAHGQEARQTGTERASACDCERSSPRGVLFDKLQRTRVALAARGDRRLEDSCPADDVHDRERMRVAMRIDTDDLAQLTCEHPSLTSSPSVGDTNGVGLGWKTAGGRT